MNKLIYLFLLLILSCSFLSKEIAKGGKVPSLPSNNSNETEINCPTKEQSTLEIVGGSKEAKETFYQFIQTTTSNGISMNFADKVIVWTLLQININPILSAPTARFQMAYQKRNIINFLDISNSPKSLVSYPVIFGLETWLKNNQQDPKRVSFWIRQLQNTFFGSFYVNEDLAQFFRQYKTQIKADPVLRSYYFHGDDVLSKGEKLPRFSWSKIYQLYLAKNDSALYQVNQSLLPYPKSSHDSISCNYDFELYDKSIFGIDKNILKGQSFGLIQGNESFMSMTIQIPQIKSIAESSLFEGSSNIRGGTFCFFQAKDTSETLWVLSQNSRDPGQLIHQMIQKGFKAHNSSLQTNQALSKMRYLFLLNPLRLIVETKRAHNVELDRLLKLDVPIYHSDNLGLVWTMKNNEMNKSYFILDPRYPGHISCKK